MVKMVKEFLLRCLRVWRITRKPEPKEFKVTSKVSAIGIAIFGLLGFAIALILSFLR